MKLLCWNIGIKIDNTKEIVKLIENNNYDIIALQEVLRAKDERAYSMYRSYNDIENSMKNTYLYSEFAPVWGANKIIKSGKMHRDFGGFVEQGCYILSKNDILEHHNQFYHLDYINPGFDATYFKKNDHARSIQNVIIDINGKNLQIINVHGIWNEEKKGDTRTLSQCQFIIDKALENDFPTIILGDFNLLPESDSINLINNKFRNLIEENNIKSTRPEFDDGLDKGNIVCDYIFVDKKIIVNEFKVINNNISDHLPLLIDFDILD